MKILLEPGRRDHDRVPAPDAPDGGEPVRHHLSRALLLLLVPHRRATSSPAHGLTLFDVEELPTHGGSLRIYARHAEDTSPACAPSASWSCRLREQNAGLDRLATYARFAEQVKETKRRLLDFLIEAKRGRQDASSATAPRARATRCSNYCGIRTDFLDYTVDRNPYKQGRFLPGTHIPIYRAGEDPRDAAGLRPDPALEPRRTRSWSRWPTSASGAGSSSCRSRRCEVFSVIFTETSADRRLRHRAERLEDERGFFARTWCRSEFEAHRPESRIAQCNVSFNRSKGTLRGMHYQAAPFDEVKLVRCTAGAMYDVIIDLGRTRPRTGSTIGVVLSAGQPQDALRARRLRARLSDPRRRHRGLLPDVAFYSPGHSRGVRWNDPAFGIGGSIGDPVILSATGTTPTFTG